MSQAPRRLKHVPSTSTAPFTSSTGLVLSRAVTFQFVLDPNVEKKILFEKCAGARRFTINHHLARVRANLATKDTEQVSGRRGVFVDMKSQTISWSAFSLINEFNSWKNGKSDDSPINEDGSRGLQWRHELPADVFVCASMDVAQALENFAASRFGARRGPPVGFPRFQHKGKVTPSFRLHNHLTRSRTTSGEPIRFLDATHLRLDKLGSIKLFGPTHNVRQMIDDGRFHIYSATVKERAGRWTVSLTGV